jgi:hypothetical protein
MVAILEITMKKQIKKLLGAKVTTISSNTIDKLIRIEVNGKWFAETKDPNLIFGKGYIHYEKTNN